MRFRGTTRDVEVLAAMIISVQSRTMVKLKLREMYKVRVDFIWSARTCMKTGSSVLPRNSGRLIRDLSEREIHGVVKWTSQVQEEDLHTVR